jgi:hypothetical protein
MLAKVMSRIPSQDVWVVQREGYDFVIGPISDLPLLFPGEASAAK